MNAGYSATPLAKKLGYKAGMRVYLKNNPDNFKATLSNLPKDVQFLKRLSRNLDMIHLFTRSSSELKQHLLDYRSRIAQNGMIWVSWPKKSSALIGDVTEDTIRAHCLPMGLVDIKVCAIDDIWSGLKLVIRKELRR